jgi:DnaJ-class molecular chaperone
VGVVLPEYEVGEMIILTEVFNLVLEESCRPCRGVGMDYDKNDDWNICSSCNGSGETPTDAGKVLLEFIRKYS